VFEFASSLASSGFPLDYRFEPIIPVVFREFLCRARSHRHDPTGRLAFAVDELPPWPRLLFLGMQHAMLLSVNLVLIVIVFRRAGAGDAATLSALSLGMIALAISTMLQSMRKGPVGVGIPGSTRIFGYLYRPPRCWRSAPAGFRPSLG